MRKFIPLIFIFLLYCFNLHAASTKVDMSEYQKRGLEVAIFAGGCFWCMEPPFEKQTGVEVVISGYTGGHVENPTYEEVSMGTTGHVEAILVAFDPKVVTYKQLLDIFWKQIDPTDPTGQFVDRGSQYHAMIYYFNDTQKAEAEASKLELSKSGKYDKPILTPIVEAQAFYEAEDYHQGFYKTNPEHYKRYRNGSGRDQYLKKIWGDKH